MDLQPLGTPHGAQGGHPATIAFVGVVKHRAGFHLVGGSLQASVVYCIFWGRTADRVLGTAEHHACPLQRTPDAFIGDAQQCVLGQVIDQTL
jgi:hypothetical protein